jgi:hypothetical protein
VKLILEVLNSEACNIILLDFYPICIWFFKCRAHVKVLTRVCGAHSDLAQTGINEARRVSELRLNPTYPHTTYTNHQLSYAPDTYSTHSPQSWILRSWNKKPALCDLSSRLGRRHSPHNTMAAKLHEKILRRIVQSVGLHDPKIPRWDTGTNIIQR